MCTLPPGTHVRIHRVPLGLWEYAERLAASVKIALRAGSFQARASLSSRNPSRFDPWARRGATSWLLLQSARSPHVASRPSRWPNPPLRRASLPPACPRKGRAAFRPTSRSYRLPRRQPSAHLQVILPVRALIPSPSPGSPPRQPLGALFLLRKLLVRCSTLDPVLPCHHSKARIVLLAAVSVASPSAPGMPPQHWSPAWLQDSSSAIRPAGPLASVGSMRLVP